MLALDATLEAASLRGTRRIPAEAFFTGLFQTALAPDELLTAIEIPLPAAPFFFQEITRRNGDYAIVGLAATAPAAGPRLALFSVGDRPVLIHDRAAVLRDLDPPGDLQATPAMRRHLAGVLLDRAFAALGLQT